MADYNHTSDWYYEGNISKKLVEFFTDNEYVVIKDNSANIKARGEDIIVEQGGVKIVVEVKGYPTEFQTKGTTKGTPKVTKPTLQAKHWFSEAILSSIFNYKKHENNSNTKLAIAFPKFERYEVLVTKVKPFFKKHKIDFTVYFVHENGEVTIDNLGK